MKQKIHVVILISLTVNSLLAQSSKTTQIFGQPIIADSSSTIIIPTTYDGGLFSSNKMTAWGNYYSNIIFYDFTADSSKRLFEKDTYITNFYKNNYYSKTSSSEKNITKNWIFYQVMNYDRNQNGKIDDNDPAILYISDTHGNGLKALTSRDENVISFEIYEKQNIALVKIQRDNSNDRNFNAKDTDYYYVKLDLKTMAFGKKIELN